MDPNHTSLLILGVDRFDVSTPRLLAIWWVIFSSIDRQITLFGLPTNASFPPPNSSPIYDFFSFTTDNGPSQEFLSRLSGLSEQFPDAIVVLDEYAFASLIDFMGGAWLDGAYYDGWSIISALQFVQEDPEMALALQASLLISLSFQTEQLGDSPEITYLTDLVPVHAFTSIPPTTLVNLLIPVLPIHSNNVHIHSWTQETNLPTLAE